MPCTSNATSTTACVKRWICKQHLEAVAVAHVLHMRSKHARACSETHACKAHNFVYILGLLQCACLSSLYSFNRQMYCANGDDVHSLRTDGQMVSFDRPCWMRIDGQNTLPASTMELFDAHCHMQVPGGSQSLHMIAGIAAKMRHVAAAVTFDGL